MERRRWSGRDGAEGVEQRRLSGGRGVETEEGTEQNCRQNLVMAEITPISGIGGVIIFFVRVKSQQMKAVGASFVEPNPPQSAQ